MFKSGSANDSQPKWMPCPKIETEYPGLHYIQPLDKLIVVQKLDALHKVISKNGLAFTIFNTNGEKVFLAVQVRSHGKFDLKIFNYHGNEVIKVKRPCRFFLSRALVWAPPDNFVGSVEQTYHKGTFYVKNRSGNTAFYIKSRGRLCNFNYDISEAAAGDKIGTVMENWSLQKVEHVYNFGVSFPEELDLEDKAVLLGACFLIGSMKVCDYDNTCISCT